MTVPRVEDVWIDPADGYSVRAVRSPSDIRSEHGERLPGMSWHTGDLWCETPRQAHSGERPIRVHIGPFVKTQAQFSPALIDRGYGPNTHYLLGRRRGGYPLRKGSKPAVEALLAKLKSEWREYRRASNPEYRIEGLRAIRRARKANDTKRLAALEERYPQAADYDRREPLSRRFASAVETTGCSMAGTPSPGPSPRFERHRPTTP